MRRAAGALIVGLFLAGCGGGEDGAAETPVATSSSSAPTTTSAAPTTATDRVASSNCTLAALTYLPLRNALESGQDVEFAVQLAADGPDFDTATTDAGGAVDLALAELNYELALANAGVLTGNLDTAPLLPALDAVDEACANF